ncbi:MAG: hypothetical protein NBV66_10110 [Burkholderiaceae bacterium]|nr:hypothetical protein [Burkholderiaceae bacterium]
MIKLIFVIASFLLSQQALAGKRPCVKGEFDLLSQMATYAGHKWTGTLKTCTVDEQHSFAIYWSAPAAGGVMSAVQRNEKIQFMVGGGMNLFCMQLKGGRWLDTGKECN